MPITFFTTHNFMQAARKLGAVSNLTNEDNEIVNIANQPDQIFNVRSTGVPANLEIANNRPIGFTPPTSMLTFFPGTPAPSNVIAQ